MNLFGDGCIGGSLVGLSYMMSYQNESKTARLVYPNSIEIMKNNNREEAASSNFMDVISGRPPPFLLVRAGAVVRICGFCDVLRRLRRRRRWNMECLESLWAAA